MTPKTITNLIKKKWPSFAALVFLCGLYIILPAQGPYFELLYSCILTALVFVSAPIVRILMFPNAARIAESGELRELLSNQYPNTKVLHYWFATLISYLVPLVCVSSLVFVG